MSLNKNKRTALGLDIGGTQIKSIAFEAPNRLVAEFTAPSRASESPEAVFEALAGIVAHYEAQGIRFDAVGAGCAGSIDSRYGLVRNSPNFKGWKDVPLGAQLTRIAGAPALVDNDANCAAYGEWATGDYANAQNMVFLTLGTGIGGGLILGGKLYRGSTGTAGELGHLSIYANGEPCPCGSRGCFERYCSGTAISTRAGCSPKEFFERLPHEAEFQSIFRQYVTDFSAALATLGNAFDPDVITLGGAVSAGLIPYLDEIEARAKSIAFPAVAAHMHLTIARQGNRAGAIGAALLALMESSTQA